MLHGNAG
jgi:hypothetical protein